MKLQAESLSRCWCGNEDLETFSEDYFRCSRCETLVAARMPDQKRLLAGQDEQGFYGHRYFDSYQVEHLGLPPIAERARRDLAERCVHWLRALLKYKLPPASVLELGSSHGGFVALMRLAGYQATGLEISPWVVDFARTTFSVPMLQGLIEDQALQGHSIDAVVLMDVLEHLPDPVNTLQHCVRLLKPGGILMIQTPSYREGTTLEELIAAGDEFVKMLLPDQHLYLFSRQSVSELLKRVGVGHVCFEPAIFSAYDMFLIGAAAPAPVIPEEEIDASLAASRDGRFARALLDLRASFEDLTARYAESEADRADRLRSITRLEDLLSEDAAQAASKGRPPEGAHLDRQIRQALKRLQASYVYRLLRRFGMWEWLHRAIVRVVPSVVPSEVAQIQPVPAKPLERVVVDLTPVLPGGENGGAKLMTIELLRQFGRIAGKCEFILLTSAVSHDELAFLDSANMRRVCVNPGSASPATPAFTSRIRQQLSRFLPARLRRLLKTLRLEARPASRNLLRQLQPDVLFYPFTAPLFFDPRVPAVSVIYDLQHVYHPLFFEPDDRDERSRNFRWACSVASKLICISDYVRQTVLENTTISPRRVETIHISIPNRVAQPLPAQRTTILDRYHLQDGAFLIYPANFWQHKNHEALLTAFGMYRAQHAQSTLKLVLTGAPGKRMDYLRDAAQSMGLHPWVIFAGFLPDDEYAALLWSSLALIFPSLYEGFGMPVLEAMAAGKPVLCSNLTSLPEVAGDAAILFDPRKPAEIAEAISRLTQHPECAPIFTARGSQRVNSFAGPEEMASRYLRVFQEVTSRPVFAASGIHGVFADGWATGHLMIAFGDGPAGRVLTVELSVPGWAKASSTTVRVRPALSAPGELHSIWRGETLTLDRLLPAEGGLVEIDVQPVFQPAACGIGQDTRWISCRLGSARIISPDGTLITLQSGARG